MTKSARRINRQQRLVQNAFDAVSNGTPFRIAAKSCRLPTSTFHRQFKMKDAVRKPSGRPPSLRPDEENVIVKTILTFAARGFPLTRESMLDAVALFCSKLPEERRRQLNFKDGRPGIDFARKFAKRHKVRVKFGKPSREEGKRLDCTNAVNLVSYASALEGIILDNHIDDRRVANIDETGFSADRDRLGATQNKRFGPRGAPIQCKLPTFSYKNRVTLLPAVFASGHVGNPLWVFNGKNVPYRAVLTGGKIFTETLSDCLPQGSFVTTREDNAAVDKNIFIQWATEFVRSIKELTHNGRKVLLLYDAYRSHMSLEALEILEKGDVIAFALPAYTSGTTQPLDVGLFQPFKQNFNKVIDSVGTDGSNSTLDIFDMCKLVTRAYEDSFVPHIIRSAFSKAGVHPFDPMKYLGVSRPLSVSSPETVVTVPELVEMLTKKREERRQGLGISSVTLKKGFVDTSAGLNLTSKEVMEKVAAKEEAERKKRVAQLAKEKAVEKKFMRTKLARRNHRALFERMGMVRRVKLYNEPMKWPRSLESRRRVARERWLYRKVGLYGSQALTEEDQAMAPWNEQSVDQYDLEPL